MILQHLIQSCIESPLPLVCNRYDTFSDAEGLEIPPTLRSDELVAPFSPHVPRAEVRWVTLGVGYPGEYLRFQDIFAEDGEVGERRFRKRLMYVY